ncbi:MAG: GNAT family N-acetyltransferase [Anaerolineae bacterium]|jgi:predicted GNAT superfamily acetyltransferase|nr:GNAT family N-acetyltransferase [Anaerolineae bacterium]
MTNSTIEIHPLETLDAMYEAVELQRTYWGNDLESVVPAHMLFTIASSGGHVLAAKDGDQMVGVLIGLLGTNIEEKQRPAMANLLIASKRMVVAPSHRGTGIGYRLKLAQREKAIQQGVRLVTWTFDPLRSNNAHLNLRKLGGVCQRYHNNLYGTHDRSGLAQFGWSDRLHVDWWVTNRRVEERISGSRPDLTLRQYLEGNATLVNPVKITEDERFISPMADIQEPQGAFALVEIPTNYDLILQVTPALAQVWQGHMRETLRKLMREGFLITDFLHEEYEGRSRAFYLLSYNMGFDFSLN